MISKERLASLDGIDSNDSRLWLVSFLGLLTDEESAALVQMMLEKSEAIAQDDYAKGMTDAARSQHRQRIENAGMRSTQGFS